MMRILLVLFTLCFAQHSFSQEITTGFGLFMNGTNSQMRLEVGKPLLLVSGEIAY